MIKTYATFEEIDDDYFGVITNYIVGSPSGEVIDITDNQFVKLKKNKLIKYNYKKQFFYFLDQNYKDIKDAIRNPMRIQEIHDIMNKLNIIKYKVNADFSVDVNGDVDISHKRLTKIPVKFGKVNGNFDCNDNNLTNLIGTPELISGFFDCSCNSIYTLIGGPKHVGGGYYCMENKLEDLEGFPKYCQIAFDASKNHLITLKGTPNTIDVMFFNVSNNRLKNLNHGPVKAINFDCSYNSITTLVGPLREVSEVFDCTYNRLFNVLGCPICGKFKYLAGNQIDDIEL